MLQIDFLVELLQECRQYGIHTALDTAGNVPFELFERVIPYTDLFLYDNKAMDNEVHKELTGVGNRLILENFKRLIGLGCHVMARIPYIPVYNEDEMNGIGEFLKDYDIVKELLPYHTMGNVKYDALAMASIKGKSVEKNDRRVAELKNKYGYL